jgi:hypothetical protein
MAVYMKSETGRQSAAVVGQRTSHFVMEATLQSDLGTNCPFLEMANRSIPAKDRICYAAIALQQGAGASLLLLF